MYMYLSFEQRKKFNEWAEKKVVPQTAIGGAYTYCFTPTEIGTIVKVIDWEGDEIDLTDDNF